MNPDLRKKIVEKIIKLSGKYKDADTKAAFMLCRGLVKDRTSAPHNGCRMTKRRRV